MFTQINDTELKATAGGLPDPAAVTGMTWEEIHADPETFQERIDAWREENPNAGRRLVYRTGLRLPDGVIPFCPRG